MQDNTMHVYTFNKLEPENDYKNLFALRWDLHSMLFDHAKWVVVPKGGEMVVHFIGQSFEAAALYHNKPFNTANLAHEFLYARFAWAIIRSAKSIVTPNRQKFLLTVPVGDPQVESGNIESDTKEKVKKRKLDEPKVKPSRGTRKEKKDVKGKGKQTKAMDDTPLDVNDFQVNEAEELKNDIILAKKIAPLFCKFVVSCFF